MFTVEMEGAWGAYNAGYGEKGSDDYDGEEGSEEYEEDDAGDGQQVVHVADDYHPVQPGEAFNRDRYIACSELGRGCHSTVWLAWDKRHSRYVALKVLRSAWERSLAAISETEILAHADYGDPDGARGVVRLIDRFLHEGPKGGHICVVLERLGDDLGAVLRRFGRPGLPLPAVKEVCRQVLVALDYLHRELRAVHGGVRPENVLLVSPLESSGEKGLAGADLRCKLAGFGTAVWAEYARCEKMQRREYRSPEVLLGADYSAASDVWSLACLCFELATGEALFDPCEGDDFDEEDDHLAAMIELLGRIPLQVARRGCRYSQFFDVYGNLKYIVELNSCPMAEVLEGSCGFSRRDADAMAKFLLPMLAYDPVQRPKPHHLLHDPWLKASADAGAEEDAFPCPLSEPSETVTNRLLIEKEEGQQRKPIGAGEDGPGEGGGGRRDEPEEEEDVFDVDDIKLVLGSLGRDRRLTEEEGKAVEPEISEAGH